MNISLLVQKLILECRSKIKARRRKARSESAYSHHDELRIHRNSSGHSGGVYHLVGNTIKAGAQVAKKSVAKKKKSWIRRLFGR